MKDSRKTAWSIFGCDWLDRDPFGAAVVSFADPVLVGDGDDALTLRPPPAAIEGGGRFVPASSAPWFHGLLLRAKIASQQLTARNQTCDRRQHEGGVYGASRSGPPSLNNNSGGWSLRI